MRSRSSGRSSIGQSGGYTSRGQVKVTVNCSAWMIHAALLGPRPSSCDKPTERIPTTAPLASRTAPPLMPPRVPQTDLDDREGRHDAVPVAALIEAGYMDPADAPEPAEIDEELALEELDALLDGAAGDSLPVKFQSRVTSALRDLEGLGIAHRLDEMSLVLARAPDLTYVVLRYVASVAMEDADAATKAS